MASPAASWGWKAWQRGKILLVRNNGSQDFVTTEGRNMLVLSRKLGEVLVIGNSITVTVVAVDGDRVRLGIAAPAEVPVHREEIYQKIGNRSSSGCFAACG
jgi:carbon storage regulator